MLETKGTSVNRIAGINQQDFDALQLVQGTFPYQFGLQQRIPGKTLNRIFDGPISSIYVFYLVYGRAFTLIDFGSITITPIVPPPIVIPILPPTSTRWFESFGEYADALTTRIWPGGPWLGGYGVCETLIEGVIDPFGLITTTPLPGDGAGGSVGGGPDSGPGDVGSPVGTSDPDYNYPIDPPSIILNQIQATANNTCYGAGTVGYTSVDRIHYYLFPGGPVDEILLASDIVPGTVVVWHGLRVGSTPLFVTGLLTQNGNPPGHPLNCGPGDPPFFFEVDYFLNAPDGSFGVET